MSGDPKLCTAYLAAMAVLAKPWNGMLMTVLDAGPLRFCELAERVPDIGDRMLVARLKELEARGLVSRAVDPGPPIRVSYELTEVGRGFRHVGDAIAKWGRTIARSDAARSPRARPAAKSAAARRASRSPA